MPIHTTYNESDDYTLITFEANWTWEELFKLHTEIYSSPDEELPSSNYIIDVRQTSLVPKEAIRYSHYFSSVIPFKDLNHLIVIGAPPIAQIIYQFLYKMKNRVELNTVLVDSPEEALALIQRVE